MKSHLISEYLDRQAAELEREEAALARLVGEGLTRIGRIYARTRLAEMLLAPEGPSEGRFPEGVADLDEPADDFAMDMPTPPSAPIRSMFGVAIPPGGEEEARQVVLEARADATGREAADRPDARGANAGATWMDELYRAAFDETSASETFISDILTSLMESSQAEADASEGQDERILRLLRGKGSAMTPREIVAELGMNPRAVGPVMGKLTRSKLATRRDDGRYVAT